MMRLRITTIRRILSLCMIAVLGIGIPMYLAIFLFPLFFPVVGGVKGPSIYEERIISNNMLPWALSVADVNADGDDDVFVAALPLPGRDASAFFLNINGELINQTEEFGLPSISASGSLFADYNNDGKPDLFVLEQIDGEQFKIRLFQNTGSRFIDVTEDAGFSNMQIYGSEGSFAAGDFNSDGKLDIVVASYGGVASIFRSEREGGFLKLLTHGRGWVRQYSGSSARNQIVKEGRENQFQERYGGVEAFLKRGGYLLTMHPPGLGLLDLFLFRGSYAVTFAVTPGEAIVFKNDEGKFSETISFAPSAPNEEIIEGAHGAPWNKLNYNFFQPVIFDFSGDGNLDLFISSSFGRPVLYENKGDFLFEDETPSELARWAVFMGVALGDIRRDGTLDLAITNFGPSLIFNRNEVEFSLAEMRAVNRFGWGWGTAFTDVNNDGYDDYFVANGPLPFPEITSIFTSVEERYPFGCFDVLRRDRLYINNEGVLSDATEQVISRVETSSSRALTTLDINRDGYEDILIGDLSLEGVSGVRALINRGGENHSVKVTLRGKHSDASIAGAKVTLIQNTGRHAKALLIGDSFRGSKSRTLIFGVGDLKTPQTRYDFEVRWADGSIELFYGLVGDTVSLVQGAGELHK